MVVQGTMVTETPNQTIIGTPELFIIVSIIIIISIVLLIMWLRFGRQQQQQQQQIIIQNEAHGKKMRVCPKCGIENDKDIKFCSDCGFKFTQ